ncbi:MAG: alpha/beta hydrolase [Clostridia bacterium]|nr:alpha/beta hydrolase [Clostridia bacterium]
MKINIDGVNINYEVMGEGKPILLLHGWGACINAMAPIWQFLKNTRKVYVLDFPGESGESDVLLNPWGVPEYAEMTKKFIEQNNIEGCDVIAHSFGGRVTIYLASKYEKLFDKIILTDAAGVKPKKTLRKSFKQKMFKAGAWCLKIFLPKDKKDEVLKKYRDKHSSADYKAIKSEIMKETFKKVISLDLTPNLKDIKNSTLLIWGEKDIDTPLYMANIMKYNIPDSGIVVIKNAGHFSYLDDSAQYNRVIDSFLNSK